jgi:putative peptidoglycan lipid II flippase
LLTGLEDNRILSALLTVSSLTAIAKVVGAAKVLLIARQFGVSGELDAFFIAFLLPAFFADISGAATTAALIPTLIEERERLGIAASRRLAASIGAWSLLLLAVFTLVAGLLAPWLLPKLASGFNERQLALTHELLLWMLPILPLTGIGATWRAVLNAEHDYAIPAAVHLLTPLATIAAVLGWSGALGVYSLVAGSLAGAALETAASAWGLRRRGLLTMVRIRPPDAAERRVLRQYIPALGASLVFSASTLVSQSMAAALGPGSVSALHYGGRVMTFILAIGPAAMGVAALPHFSQLAARRAWEQIRATFRSYLRLILVVAVPAVALLMVFSEIVVRILFERGRFTAADTLLVAEVQRYYLLQIPAAMLVALSARAISSLKSNDTLLWGSLLAVTAQVVLTRAFAGFMDAPGIALAASSAVYIYLCYLLAVLLRWNRVDFAREFPRRSACDTGDD